MKTTRIRRTAVPVVGIAVAALALSACAPPTGPGGEEIDCADYEAYGTPGGEVELYTTIAGVEADQLQESVDAYSFCTETEVNLVSSQEFETQINVRVQGGDAPDLAIFPQPGLLQRIASTGAVVAAPAEVEANVDEYWTEAWKEYGTVDGTFYAAPLMASVKGYIWYSPAQFEELGVEVPTTWQGLMDLTAQLAENNTDTYRPWCVGFGSGDATGWPGTDWIEDLVLREAGPDAYDAWVAGELPFDSPEISAAWESAGEILRNPEYVNGGYGGVESINSTTFNDGGLPILEDNCSLHHQASFYEAQWPEGTTVAPDGDIWAFLTPPVNEGDPASVTGGGEFVAAFNDNEETAALQAFLSSSEWANIRVELGGVISANNGLDPAVAGSDIGRQSIEILQGEDTVFRFDGSDLMPAAVGSASFWTGLVDWIGGKDTTQTLQDIDATWP
ncbi:ABC transporter substrate-binding protein [Arenivirga flava]|uniref:Alpha-glucoside ABC transporter substrate-binding protein n=1 Tax=Arenivirga flava TaxID=1930060 RepID=A0AA37UHT6_9MICO|nr:ABC transporter substrate-binding protein [Arenivirga flava]GMA29269.1 alpha-glucoside ABC transporter substrate-binding protein [Arenivirga flava]